MSIRIRVSVLLLTALTLPTLTFAQQTLGGITGSVSDESGAMLPGTTVTVVGNETTLTRTQTTSDSGTYLLVNLPIGSYTVTFTHDGFQTQKIPSIMVQADRTVTVNAS